MRMKFAFPFAILFLCARAQADLPPDVYVEMQKKAGEFLKIEVLNSKKESVAKESSLTPFELKSDTRVFGIRLSAKVLDVERSKSSLKEGDVISIDYMRTERPKEIGWVGPSEIPLLKKGDVSKAYLDKSSKSDSYTPAARGRSFQTIDK